MDTNRADKRDENRDLPSLKGGLEARLRRFARFLCETAVERGLHPSKVGYRHVRPVTADTFAQVVEADGAPGANAELVHSEKRAANPLPFNVGERGQLSDDAGWWGYSMYDVPDRTSSATRIFTLPDARIVSYVDERNEYYPAILTREGRTLNLREIVFRNRHAEVLRENPPVKKFGKVTWICERVYDNHSHWLTAHLPKLCLLRERGELGNVLLPMEITEAMRASIRLMGLDPDAFATFEPGGVLQVEQLTVLSTDRFRSELLQPVRDAIAITKPGPQAERRVYISRMKARMRRLTNEEEIWPLFEKAGFERVVMENLDFEAQVRLMSQTAVLAAPHGAGLTNMMFCPASAHVLEIAWLGFPNPNFYALASAMGHRWGIVAAEPAGDSPIPLERDLAVDPAAIRQALAALEKSIASTRS